MIASFSYKADYDRYSHKRKVLILKSDNTYIEGIDINFLKEDKSAQKTICSLKILPNETLLPSDPRLQTLKKYMRYYRRYKVSNIR